MCLKKYCECYQTKVGCWDGCRCEGCQNVYGKKVFLPQCRMNKHPFGKEDTNKKMDAAFLLIILKLCRWKPMHVRLSFAIQRQHSTMKESVSNVWFPSKKYSPRIAYHKESVLGFTKEILGPVSFDQESDINNTENTGILSSIPNSQVFADNSKSRSYENRGYSSWRASSNAPAANSRGMKPLKLINLDDLFKVALDDGLPDILKDNPTPLNVVKVSTPNKKRVSPPHRPVSSIGVRSGRKFILKSVPSLPRFTPYSNSKNGSNLDTRDSKNCSGGK